MWRALRGEVLDLDARTILAADVVLDPGGARWRQARIPAARARAFELDVLPRRGGALRVSPTSTRGFVGVSPTSDSPPAHAEIFGVRRVDHRFELDRLAGLRGGRRDVDHDRARGPLASGHLGRR